MLQEHEYRVIEDYLCVKMPKEIDHHNAQDISRGVDHILCQGKVNHLVFDFDKTDFMDSSGIGIIAGRYKKVNLFGGRVYVINAGRQVRRILLLSGLDKYVILKKD